MERQTINHGFGPFYRKDSNILILGSFPSMKSREQAFFYGHPQNRFWKVLAMIFVDKLPETVQDKKVFLEKHHIALYDVIEQCSIIGSSDASIRNVVPAGLNVILSNSSVTDRIYTNGKKAYTLYRKYQEPVLGIEAVALPSTSPANAAVSLDDLVKAWEEIKNPY